MSITMCKPVHIYIYIYIYIHMSLKNHVCPDSPFWIPPLGERDQFIVHWIGYWRSWRRASRNLCFELLRACKGHRHRA